MFIDPQIDPQSTVNTNRSTNKDATGGKYNTQMFTYPADLFGNGAANYSNAWTMININVLSTSKAAKQYETVELDVAEREAKLGSVSQDRKTTVGQANAASVGAGAITGALAAGSLASLLSNPKAGAAGALAGAIKGGVLGGLANIPIISAQTAARETKRLAIAIQLPMPNNLMSSYSMDWDQDATALFDLIMRVPKYLTGGNKSPQAQSSDTSILGDAASMVSLGMQTNSFLSNGGISAASGLAANPKRELVFSGVNFRNFSLDYKFYPRSMDEAMKVHMIIQTLKYHMHPEYRTSEKFTFIYPSEFDITFFRKDGEENNWVGRVATCVLTNMNVNYTPDGLWASHEGGVPNAISLSMQFRELSILTKDEIDKGY